MFNGQESTRECKVGRKTIIKMFIVHRLYSYKIAEQHML
jgi:hypothetical protein